MHNIIQPPHHTCHNQYIHALHWCWINILRSSDLWIMIAIIVGFTYPSHFLRIHFGKRQFRCCCCVIAVISLMRCQKTWSNKLYGPWRLNLSWRWHCLDYNVLYLKCRVSLKSWQVLHFFIGKKTSKERLHCKKGRSSKGFAEVFGFWVDSRASLTVQITFSRIQFSKGTESVLWVGGLWTREGQKTVTSQFQNSL